MYDVLIRNGKVITGMGNPWLFGDVAIAKDKIVKIGKLSKAEAKIVIDAAGHFVSDRAAAVCRCRSGHRMD